VCSRKKSGEFSIAVETLDTGVTKEQSSQIPRCNSGVSDEVRMRFVLLIILLLLVLGALPTWPYSGEWGYYPSSGLGLVLIIVLILVLMGRL
jgi:Protein of unknown function (DUF3309)